MQVPCAAPLRGDVRAPPGQSWQGQGGDEDLGAPRSGGLDLPTLAYGTVIACSHVTGVEELRLAGMRIGWWAGLLLVGGMALVLAGCSSPPPVSRHTPTPPSTAASTPTPATGPVLTTLSAADRAAMASAYVNYMDSLKAGLFPPGSIGVHQSYAALMPDGAEWALADMSLNPGAPTTPQEQGALQGAGDAVYFRVPGGSTWLLRGLATEPACSSMPHVGVPPAVAELWGMSETCPH